MIRGQTGAILSNDIQQLDKYTREKQLNSQMNLILSTLREIKTDLDLIKRELNVKNNPTN